MEDLKQLFAKLASAAGLKVVDEDPVLTDDIATDYAEQIEIRDNKLKAEAKAMANDLSQAFEGFEPLQIMQLMGTLGFGSASQYFFSRRRADQQAERLANETVVTGTNWSSDRNLQDEISSPLANTEQFLMNAQQDAAAYEVTNHAARILWERAAEDALALSNNPNYMPDYPRRSTDGQMAFDISEAAYMRYATKADASWAQKNAQRKAATVSGQRLDYRTNVSLISRRTAAE